MRSVCAIQCSAPDMARTSFISFGTDDSMGMQRLKLQTLYVAIDYRYSLTERLTTATTRTRVRAVCVKGLDVALVSDDQCQAHDDVCNLNVVQLRMSETTADT